MFSLIKEIFIIIIISKGTAKVVNNIFYLSRNSACAAQESITNAQKVVLDAIY